MRPSASTRSCRVDRQGLGSDADVIRTSDFRDPNTGGFSGALFVAAAPSNQRCRYFHPARLDAASSDVRLRCRIVPERVVPVRMNRYSFPPGAPSEVILRARREAKGPRLAFGPL